MGSFFSIDSCSSTNDLINSIVFNPPDVPTKETIEKLEKNDKLKVKKFVTGSGNNICGLETIPRHYFKKDKIIIYSHGNAEDIYHCADFMLGMADLFGIDVMTYDYPGYGMSDGTPTEMGCYEALDSVIKYYVSLNKKIILVGRSLGSGVVVECVTRQKNWTYPITLISAYKSIPRVALDYPIESSIQKYKFQSIYKINKLTCPVKLIHGTNDEVISFSHSQDLYKKLKNKSFNLTLINGAGHNDIFNYTEFLAAFSEPIYSI